MEEDFFSFFFFSSRLASVAPRWSEMAEEGRRNGFIHAKAEPPSKHVLLFPGVSYARICEESVNASDVLFSRLDNAKHSREFKGKNKTKKLFLLPYLPTRHFDDKVGGKKEREKKEFPLPFCISALISAH